MADSPVVLWQNPGEEDRGRGPGGRFCTKTRGLYVRVRERERESEI